MKVLTLIPIYSGRLAQELNIVPQIPEVWYDDKAYLQKYIPFERPTQVNKKLVPVII